MSLPFQGPAGGKSGRSERPTLGFSHIGASVAADDGALLEGLEFEGEAGKVADLNPIGVTANSLARAKTTTGAVSADSRKGLARDSLFTGEDEAFAFERAISRLYEMQSSSYMEARERG